MREPERAIRDEIERRGPIGFDRYMEIALYGLGGFYEDPPVGTGEGAAFATSPHVHEVFARLLAGGLRELHEGLGRPDPFRVVEAGAGDGTLATELATWLEDLPLRYEGVERSSGAREALSSRGIPALEEVPTFEGVLIANELLDNLPFRLVRRAADGDRPDEVRVTIVDDALSVTTAPCDDTLRALVPATPGPGEEVAVPTGAFAFVDALAARLRRGYAVLIDYASAGSADGAVHGYRNQRIVEDVLADPGSTDITAGVDLDAVGRHAERTGFRVLGTPTQHAALRSLGFDTWSAEQLEHQGTLLDRREGLDAVRAWSGRSRATLLTDPAALGRLRWLVLAIDGNDRGDDPLPEPDWLRDANERSRAPQDG
ncbi:MAG: SAM-dependent methyltransferase [Actinomycetota bacterium]